MKVDRQFIDVKQHQVNIELPVGQILAELPESLTMKEEYRYYM